MAVNTGCQVGPVQKGVCGWRAWSYMTKRRRTSDIKDGSKGTEKMTVFLSALQDSCWVPHSDISLVKMYFFFLYHVKHMRAHHIAPLKACLMQPRSVVCQLNYAEWARLSSVLLSKFHILEDTRRLSFPQQLIRVWLCISKAPLCVCRVVWSQRLK